MEGVYNIVFFDNDMCVCQAIDSLTITPTNEDKKVKSDSHIDCQGRHYFVDLVGIMGPYQFIVTHYGTMGTHRDYFIICTDDYMINRDN